MSEVSCVRVDVGVGKRPFALQFREEDRSGGQGERAARSEDQAAAGDSEGRRFSREDYGQISPHGILGQDSSGRTVPHEHGYNFSDFGPIGK